MNGDREAEKGACVDWLVGWLVFSLSLAKTGLAIIPARDSSLMMMNYGLPFLLFLSLYPFLYSLPCCNVLLSYLSLCTPSSPACTYRLELLDILMG